MENPPVLPEVAEPQVIDQDHLTLLNEPDTVIYNYRMTWRSLHSSITRAAEAKTSRAVDMFLMRMPIDEFGRTGANPVPVTSRSLVARLPPDVRRGESDTTVA